MGRSIHRTGLALASALLASCAGGCDGVPRASSSTAEGTVTGLVTLAGKPVAGGKLQFNPANSARPTAGVRSADIGPDGRYTARTLVGGNVVTPMIPDLGRKGDARRAVKSIEVTAGENSLDVDIPPFRLPPTPKP